MSKITEFKTRSIYDSERIVLKVVKYLYDWWNDDGADSPDAAFYTYDYPGILLSHQISNPSLPITR